VGAPLALFQYLESATTRKQSVGKVNNSIFKSDFYLFTSCTYLLVVELIIIIIINVVIGAMCAQRTVDRYEQNEGHFIENRKF
jgi:cell division protein FtsX